MTTQFNASLKSLALREGGGEGRKLYSPNTRESGGWSNATTGGRTGLTYGAEGH